MVQHINIYSYTSNVQEYFSLLGEILKKRQVGIFVQIHILSFRIKKISKS